MYPVTNCEVFHFGFFFSPPNNNDHAVITFLTELTLPEFRAGRHSCLPPSSLHTLSPSLSAASPCCDKDSKSEGTREGVSDPWFNGDEDREGDSRKRRMVGWFSTAGSLLNMCWETEECDVVTSDQPKCLNVNIWVGLAHAEMFGIFCWDLPLLTLSFQHWQSNWPLYMPEVCPSFAWLHWVAVENISSILCELVIS